MDIKKGEAEQVAWNLSAGVMQEIQSLINKSSTNYLNGNISQMFYCLKAIKFLISPTLIKHERRKLYARELLITKNLNIFSKTKKVNARILAMIEIEAYHEMLMDFLQEYGYLMVKKKDAKRIR